VIQLLFAPNITKNGIKANTEKSKPAQKEKSKDRKKKGKKAEPVAIESESSDSSAEDTPSETEEDTEEETKAQSAKKKSKQKGNDKKKTEAKATNKRIKASAKQETKQQADDKKASKERQKKKSRKKDDKSSPEPESESLSETEPGSEVEVLTPKKTKSKKKKEEKPKGTVRFPPTYSPPDMRKPNLLLPPRTSVMQVEHAVEVPEDPRPNAFYDNDSGTMRVYHGPTYGNPYGMLYPKRVYSYQHLPVGVPHPTQNPWYNGFPTVNGQPVPPHVHDLHGPPQGTPRVPSQEVTADEKNPWFQGWGTVGPVPIPSNVPPAPDFGSSMDKEHRERRQRQSLSPKLSRELPEDRDAGWNTNVIPIPSVEITAPDGWPAKMSDHSHVSQNLNRSPGSKAGSLSGRLLDAQGAPGSKGSLDTKEAPVTEKSPDKKNSSSKNNSRHAKTLPDQQAAKKKKDTTADIFSVLGKALQAAAKRDVADLRAREERWSNRSGSSKEASPQPTTELDQSVNNTHTKSKDNNNGGGDLTFDNIAPADHGWDDGNVNEVNTNDNNGWDDAACIDVANTTGNDGWNIDGANTVDNNNEQGSNNDNLGTANRSMSPFPKGSNPMPGTWASRVPSASSSKSNKLPSNYSGGNVGGHASPMPSVASNGSRKRKTVKAEPEAYEWGDQTLAQTSGGYWDSAAGQADLPEGGNGGNGSSWW
jgi:hypothetical protein